MIHLHEKLPRCLVTGATGFIGSRLCERLKLRGKVLIRALVRDSQKAHSLAGSNVEICVGDLLDPKSIEQAINDCDMIIHLANSTRGTEATSNLIEIACLSPIQRFVHISSMAVHGPKPGLEATSEETASMSRCDDEYFNCKVEQEELIWKAMNSGTLQGVILRPTIVYGPKSSFVKQILEEAKTGKITLIDKGTGLCNAVFVDDVCDAIEAALFRQEALGNAFFINGNPAVTWKEFILAFASFIQPLAQVKHVSSKEALDWWLAHPEKKPAHGLLQLIVRKVIRLLTAPQEHPPYPGRILRELYPIELSNQKAIKLLGWIPQVDFATGVAKTRKWFESESLD